jgi:hypothetical protein
MNSSIPELKKKVALFDRQRLQKKCAIEELKSTASVMSEKISRGSLYAVSSLKTIQIKIRDLRRLVLDLEKMIDSLKFKISQLESNDQFFTRQDIHEFEKALNDHSSHELMVDLTNPLFSNRGFLESIKSQLEDFEYYEKCALLQKRIEKINP